MFIVMPCCFFSFLKFNCVFTKMSFAVVIFDDGNNEVSEVPDNWLIDKEGENYC